MIETLLHKHSRIWIVSPHADDEILGCGGLISRAREQQAEVFVLYVSVAAENLVTSHEITTHADRRREIADVAEAAGFQDSDCLFPDGEHHLTLDALPVRNLLEWLEVSSHISFRKIQPDVVLLPCTCHTNQDHRQVFLAALPLLRAVAAPNAKDRMFLEYEIPATGAIGLPRFAPNLYLELNKDHLNQKCDWYSLYRSQVAHMPHLRSLYAIRALAQMRGIEAGYELAEAYSLLSCKVGTRT